MRKTSALAAVVLGLTVTLSACGSDDTSTDTATEVSTTEHNDADVAFATDMIRHHAQALSMVDLTINRDLDPDVMTLAEDIRAAQGPEIESMVDWLTTWGEDVPETMRDHVNSGHGHDMGDLSDMMEGMDALENASDAEFQDMWLDMMIEHHEGAVEMAEAETTDGQYKPAVDLARGIVETQTAEIQKMEGLR